MYCKIANKKKSTNFLLEPINNKRLSTLCGPLDQHLRQIEKHMDIEINNISNNFYINGNYNAIHLTSRLIKKLYLLTEKETLSPKKIHLHLMSINLESNNNKNSTINTKKRLVESRNVNQKKYLENIRKYDINFGIGPAGTGKTYIAIACAVAAIEEDRVKRIVLVRPAVEAGERLGFLPGDIEQKVDPYLRPLYDALYKILDFKKVSTLIEQNIIEIAPLAFMRGRTLNDSFIILDEAQNTTIEQMKMFLTRIGFNSTAIITGDVTQIDLPYAKQSGLKHVINILEKEKDISFTFFTSKDVVRHPLVARILNAYEKHEH